MFFKENKFLENFFKTVFISFKKDNERKLEDTFFFGGRKIKKGLHLQKWINNWKWDPIRIWKQEKDVKGLFFFQNF